MGLQVREAREQADSLSVGAVGQAFGGEEVGGLRESAWGGFYYVGFCDGGGGGGVVCLCACV